jgi:hypothetical protein
VSGFGCQENESLNPETSRVKLHYAARSAAAAKGLTL